MKNLQSKRRKLEEELRQTKAELKQEQDLRKILDERLEQLNEHKFNLKKSGLVVRYGAGSFFRVALPDTHGVHIVEDVFAAFLEDMRIFKPKQFVYLGDHVDCGGFLAQHQTLGYVAESEYTYEQDINHANSHLDEIFATVGPSEYWYLEGNHEQRVEKWCITQALRNSRDGEFLRKKFAPNILLNLEKRGIPYIRRGEHYNQLRIPGTIKLGKCYFTHGHTASKHECAAMANRFNSNVVFGHTHRSDFASKRTVNDGLICAWNPGFMAKLQPYWQHSNLTDWSHGYAIQMVQANGHFLHINVPIIDGKSYIHDFLELIK